MDYEQTTLRAKLSCLATLLASLLAVSGCSSESVDDDAAGDAGAELALIQEPSFLAWWSYDRPAQFTTSVSQVEVPMRDGIKLGCRLSRPAQDGQPAEGRFPGLIVEFTPYWLVVDLAFAPTADFFTVHGYNTLLCTLRGVGASCGTWQGASSATSWQDAHDLVEWLAAQPFSTERIGQMGTSYGGFTSWGSAIAQPPHLRAVAPLQAPASLYDDVNYPGGIETTPRGTINSWPDMASLLSGFAFSADAEYDTWHAHPMFDAYWQERSFATHYAQVQVPVLASGGWKDEFFRAGSVRNFENTRDRTWLIYGQWSHYGIGDDLLCSDKCNLPSLSQNVTLAWFDRWLLDRATPVPDVPLFMSYEGPTGIGKGWRAISNWDANTPSLAYQLTPNGGLDATSAKVQLAATFHEPGEEANAALTFTAAELSQDFVLAGYPLFAFRATLSAPDANFYVQLIDVATDGTEIVVNDGFLKASHRDSNVNPTPVAVGQPADYSLRIRPQHFRFAAGHRIRLRIWGGNADTLLPVAPVAVTLERATLTIPSF